MSLLTVENLEFSYGGLRALRDITFHVDEGEIVSIIGANGAGKTTTANNIAGLYTPDAGTIQFKSDDVTGYGADKMVESGVTLVPEKRHLFPELTVEENLVLGSQADRAKQNRASNFEWVFDIFPRLEERREQTAGSMSGGEQQMLAIARGLMSEPDLLILDEPLVGLMPSLVDEVIAVTQRIRDEGITVLIVEQTVQRLLSISDRGYVIEKGETTITGSGEELLDNEHVKEAFLGL